MADDTSNTKKAADVAADADAAANAAADGDVLDTDADPDQEWKQQFLNLPREDAHCKSVDTSSGLWAICGTCDDKVVKTRICDRPAFNLARWNEHIKGQKHLNNVEDRKTAELLRLKEKGKQGSLTKTEKRYVEMHTCSQKNISDFFSTTTKRKVEDTVSIPSTAAATAVTTASSGTTAVVVG